MDPKQVWRPDVSALDYRAVSFCPNLSQIFKKWTPPKNQSCTWQGVHFIVSNSWVSIMFDLSKGEELMSTDDDIKILINKGIEISKKVSIRDIRPSGYWTVRPIDKISEGY